MTTVLTKDAVQEALDKAIAERGADYVYDVDGGCHYATWSGDRPEPSCIVGFVVDAIDHEAFQEVAIDERYEGGFDVSEMFHEKDLGIAADDAVRDALAVAQEAQDAGLTWGYARSLATRLLSGEGYFEVRREMQDVLDVGAGK